MSKKKIGAAPGGLKKKTTGSNSVTPAQATLIIGSVKENAQLTEAVKLYEARQYKKSIKSVDAILKKNSSHFDSLALKALNLFFINDKDQAESYVKKATGKVNGNNSLCTHTGSFILGMYYKNVKNYEDAAKWYQISLDNGSPNKQIHRELAVLYTQLRNYEGAVTQRTQFLQAMMGYRANWTGLALALDLSGKPDQAAKYLAQFEELAKGKLGPAEMYENNECVMYKNDLYYKSAGTDSEKLKTVLKDLDLIENDVYDKYALLERRASIYMRLGDFKNASKVYRQLIKRNPDDFKYYNLLEVALNISDSESLKLALYEKLQEFYPRSEPPKYLPLTFLTNESRLKTKLSEYILPLLKRGVLAVFNNLKPLYKKRSDIVPRLVEEIVEEFLANSIDSNRDNGTYIWTLYFLAQHYLYSKNFIKAQEFINKAIEHTPTAIELYIVKARILKHLGLLEDAARVIEEARQLDLQDRYINNKSVKYYLRCNNMDKAVELISLFTKMEEKDLNGIKDLHTLESGWFLVEQAESYYRLYLSTKKQILETLRNNSDLTNEDEQFDELKYDMSKYKGLALKRFIGISKIYDNFNVDQYDFHSYCPRKGTARAYLDFYSWANKIFTLPIYIRAMEGCSKILLSENSKDDKLIFPEDASVVSGNKNKKKAKKSLKQKQADDELKCASELNDKDPLGEKLLSVKSSLDLFLTSFFNKYNNEVSAGDKDDILEFLINFQQKKLVICIAAMNKLLGKNKKSIVGAMCLMLVTLVEESSESLDAITKTVVTRSLNEQFKFSQELFLASGNSEENLSWFKHLQEQKGTSVSSLLMLYHFYSQLEDETAAKYISVDELKTHILDSIKEYDPIEQANILNYEL